MAAAGAEERAAGLARPALPVGLIVLLTAGGERVRATIVAATARREYVLIEQLVPGALAPAPSAGGPAAWREVHVSQLMPVASDVPVPPYAAGQRVWAQCPATGHWAPGRISSLSEQHFHTG
jgi:hypothetical protein